MTPTPRRPVTVWDLPVRLFHWSAAALVAALWVTERWNWMDWHVLAGETLLALLLFRLLWGLFGSETARFARFLTSPRAALHHLAHLFAREPDDELGHNPAGGWMVVALLGLMTAECLTGIFVNNDVADEGPFTELVPAWFSNLMTDLHTILFQALIAAVTLHIATVALYFLLKGQNLVRPMLTGTKTLPTTTRPPKRASLTRALLLLALATAVTTALATWG